MRKGLARVAQRTAALQEMSATASFLADAARGMEGLVKEFRTK